MRWLAYILSIVAHVLLIFCLIGLARRSAFKKVPFFFSYVLYEELQFATSLAVIFWAYHGGPKALYQWVTVIGGVGISSLVQFAVFYEIVNILILPRSPALMVLRPLIRWVSAAALLAAVGISATFSWAGLLPLTHTFEILNFSANVVNLSLLLVLFLFARTFHISWKSLPAGIALGFGITSSTEMGATSFISALGVKGIIPSDLVRMLGFLVCTLVWLVYIFLPEARPQFTGQDVQRSEMEIWEQQLEGIVKQ